MKVGFILRQPPFKRWPSAAILISISNPEEVSSAVTPPEIQDGAVRGELGYGAIFDLRLAAVGGLGLTPTLKLGETRSKPSEPWVVEE